MPAVHIPGDSRTTFNDVAYQLVSLIARATSGVDEPNKMNATHAQKPTTGLWSATSVDAKGILAAQQRRHIQTVCAAMASISICAAICAIYWFWMMRRNYRRDLVLMLILGDFYKSMWYLIYGSVNFGRSQVQSDEAFCQVSGFMLQMALQACGKWVQLILDRACLANQLDTDVAILFISMHMALQIFPPTNSILGHDGLYKVRRWVFAIWILLPCFTAALAFANPDGAYQAQGAFCWLPIRPFWYRLALSWVPRYFIWLYIMWVAIRIYSHVGYEFRVFGQERDRSSSTDISAQSSAERGAVGQAVREHRSQIRSSEKMNDDIAPDDSSMPGPMSLHSPPDDIGSPAHVGRRMSLPAWHSPFGPNADMSTTPTARSNPTSRRGSRQIAPGVLAEDFMAPPGFDFTRPRGSVSTITSMPISINGASLDPTLAPIEEGRGSVSDAGTTHTDIGARALRQRRRAIQRQLRILFIYPVVYMAMWLIPFVVHCMSYSDYYAQNPIFPLSLLSSFCQTFMGFADVSVFCWRERPWRHIPGSDGTFLGSFVFWKCYNEKGEWSRRASKAPGHMPSLAEQSQTKSAGSSQSGLLATLRRWSTVRKNSSPSESTYTHSLRPTIMQKRTFSGVSRTREAELAHERLKLEREDYEKHRTSLDQRRESVAVPVQAPRKEWFDQNYSADTIDVTSERNDSH
jgi:G protein-coupled receptor GPR1